MNTSAARWCVLIPCLNEEAAIGEVVQSVLALGVPVIVVDDGSDDRTPEIVRELPVTLLRHPQRSGKGEALRTGFREALRQGFDAVLTMDGDGQHLAGDVPRIAAAAQRYPNHIVIGARLLQREQQPKGRRRAALSDAAAAMFDEDLRGRILAFDAAAADRYAEVIVSRRQAGAPIHTFDALIAATALVARAAVVTASPRSLPLLTYSIAPVVPVTAAKTCPPRRSVNAGAAPR